MRFEPIDILMVHFNKNHIGGDLFDTFEYFQFFKKHTKFKIKLLVISDVDAERALLGKYDQNKITFDDVEFMSSGQIKDRCADGISFKYHPKVIFSSSSFELLNFMITLESRKIITPYDKLVGIINGTYDYNNEMMKKVSNRIKNNLVFLCDKRFKDEYKEYSEVDYRRKIYFDIFKENDVAKTDTTLLNMHTPHKRYNFDMVKKCVEYYDIKKLLIYCHEDNLLDCMKMKIDGVVVDILIPPIDNLLDRFDRYIYIPVERKWDVSPRLIPEAVWFGKQVDYMNLGTIKDGSYHRYMDTMNDFDGLILREGDEIVNILKGYMDE